MKFVKSNCFRLLYYQTLYYTILVVKHAPAPPAGAYVSKKKVEGGAYPIVDSPTVPSSQ